MPVGVYYALAAYAIFSFGDAVIKSLGSGANPFQMGLLTAFVSAIPVILTRPKSEKLVDIFKAKRPMLLHIRAILAYLAVLCVVYTFTNIPFAEAYSIIFLAPIFSTILAVIVLKEDMTRGRWFGLALGFVGVLLVVRPGFRELSIGHLAALFVAILGSGVAILLRHVSQTEQRITIISYGMGYTVVLNTIILLAFGMDFIPEPVVLTKYVAIGLAGGFGNVLIVLAAKNAPAAWVAPSQYSQILWAVLLGALIFSEFPGVFTLAGLIVVAVGGYFSFPPGNTPRSPVGGFAFLAAARRPRRPSNGKSDQAD